MPVLKAPLRKTGINITNQGTMKLNRKNILACALCAGLMTVGASRVKAIVIEDELFTPLTIQLSAFAAPSDNGKIVKVRISNKDILNVLSDTFGENFKRDQLAVALGNSDTGDIVIINKNGVVEDLSEGNDMNIDLEEVVSSESDTPKKRTFAEAGNASFTFYSDPQFDFDNDTQEFDIFDQAASEDDSDFWLELTGTYNYTETETSKKNSNKVKLDTSLKATFNGVGFDDAVNGLDEPDGVPVSGFALGSASGSVIEP